MNLNIKNTLLLSLFLISVLNSFGQTQFTATYSRVKQNWGVNDTQTLVYKEGKSQYSFYQKKEKKDVDYYQIELGYQKYESIYDINTKTIVEQNELSNGTLLLAQWKSDLKWEILDETKTINGYKVQKAVAESYNYDKSRSEYFGNATAWFTLEIPVGIGPFRYYGLPGLIVKLEFDQYGATYTLTNIDFKKQVSITTPKEGISITREESIDPTSIRKEQLKKNKSKK